MDFEEKKLDFPEPRGDGLLTSSPQVLPSSLGPAYSNDHPRLPNVYALVTPPAPPRVFPSPVMAPPSNANQTTNLPFDRHGSDTNTSNDPSSATLPA